MTNIRERFGTIGRTWLLLVLGLASASASAQSFSITSISPADGNIGQVTSDTSGTTTYKISAANGSSVRTGGSGLPATATGTRALVTLKCTGNGNTCGDNKGSTVVATIKIDALGTPTGRALALTNFNVAAGTATPSALQGSGASHTFTITGNFRSPNDTKTFYLGADFPIANTGTSGASTSQYLITASGTDNPSGSTSSGSFSATVRRSLTLVKNSDLEFGSVLRPSSGTNTITIDKDSGARSISGGGTGSLFGTNPGSRAAFTVTGEVGQVFSITAPATVAMNRTGGGSITANLVRSGTSGSLTGTAGAEGTATIGVGGNFNVTSATIPGTYTGTFLVTVAYN